MADILIVEDEKDLAQAYQIILKTHGHSIRTATDGESAFKLLHKHSPDIILLDMRMPGMDGLGLLRKLKKHPDVSPKSSVVVFSNLDMEQDIDEAYRLGAKKYILKSWASPQNLVKIVDEVLAK